jgi:hypothetical protein
MKYTRAHENHFTARGSACLQLQEAPLRALHRGRERRLVAHPPRLDDLGRWGHYAPHYTSLHPRFYEESLQLGTGNDTVIE